MKILKTSPIYVISGKTAGQGLSSKDEREIHSRYMRIQFVLNSLFNSLKKQKKIKSFDIILQTKEVSGYTQSIEYYVTVDIHDEE